MPDIHIPGSAYPSVRSLKFNQFDQICFQKGQLENFIEKFIALFPNVEAIILDGDSGFNSTAGHLILEKPREKVKYLHISIAVPLPPNFLANFPNLEELDLDSNGDSYNLNFDEIIRVFF